MKYKITRDLCEQQLSLTNRDIEIIIETIKVAEYITQIETCDVFIDIKSNFENSALVVFESRPISGESSYKNSVVGEQALRKNEPGVLRSLELGIHTKNIRAKTQENIWVKQNVIPIKNKEKTIAVLITERNISKEILIGRKIKSLAKDNELLRREIHHRVKNNLQTIASLLRLQSRSCIGDEAKLALIESGNRILSIATTHELLSKQVLDNISIVEVLSNIKNNILRCFSNSKKVCIDIIGDDFIVDSDKSTTIALIVNELFQNSMEHAFIGRDTGCIKLILQSIGEYKIIKVIDDGIGFDINNTREYSLGSRIVSSYVKDKLKGNLIIESSERGTSIIIKFIV